MFSIPRVNVIESDSGFSVEVLGHTGLRYREGDRTCHVDSEVLVGPGMMVAASSIGRWDPPHTEENIDDLTKTRIIENIRAAFRFRGIEIEVAW